MVSIVIQKYSSLLAGKKLKKEAAELLKIAQQDVDENVKGLLQAAIASGLNELKKLASTHLPSGQFASIAPEDQKKLPYCPPTNDHTESDFAQAKYMKRHSPNQRFETIEGKLQFSANRTAKSLPRIKQLVPNIIETSMKEQRISRAQNTRKKQNAEFGKKQDERFEQKIKRRKLHQEKIKAAMEKLSKVVPWTLDSFTSMILVPKAEEI